MNCKNFSLKNKTKTYMCMLCSTNSGWQMKNNSRDQRFCDLWMFSFFLSRNVRSVFILVFCFIYFFASIWNSFHGKTCVFYFLNKKQKYLKWNALPVPLTPDGRILASYFPWPKIWSNTFFSFSRKLILALFALKVDTIFHDKSIESKKRKSYNETKRGKRIVILICFSYFFFNWWSKYKFDKPKGNDL